MSSEWPIVQLDDCVDLITGYPFKSAEYSDQPGTIKLLRGDNIGQGQLRWDGERRWPAEKTSGIESYYLAPQDVVLAMDRPWIPAGLKFAKVRKEDLPALLVQRVACIRPRIGITANYLYYVLASREFCEYIQNVTTGTAVPHISATQIREYKFRLPDQSTQRLVGEFLAGIDDRITLLRETNATLEAIAQALFKSWFVDFDPVRAKQEGRAPEGMDEATAALFPDGFEESELGVVPMGWSAGSFSDVARLHRGSINPLSKPDILFEHYSLPAFDSGQMPIFESGSEIKSNKTQVPASAVLLSKLNPHIPRVWMPTSAGTTAICSTEFLVFEPKGSASKEFLYCAFSTPQFQQLLCQLVTGTSNSHQRVKPNGVLAMPAIVPLPSVLESFEAVARPILERVGHNRQKAKTLASLRDTLLPRLISGQLRLPEAESAIDAAM